MDKITKESLKKSAKRLGLPVEQMPRSIAIIMDGNGRWAQEKRLPRALGHMEGAKTVERIIDDSVNLGIESLSLYSFSTDNWKRPKAEIHILMNLFARYLIKLMPTMMKKRVKLIHLGRLNNLPSKLKKELAKSIEMTRDNTGLILALALNYGSRTEITDATRKIAREFKNGNLKMEDINEQCISRHLYTAGLADPDLLIRTGKEMRVSNFLLWQISYSEFCATETYWPDFRKEDLEKAILTYASHNSLRQHQSTT